jgi:hypothetical protein
MVITLVVIIVVLVATAGVIGFALERRRQRELRERFGGEYDRTVVEAGDRRRGERELVSRQKRHDMLDIRPLDPARAQDYRVGWETAQTRFVDDPRGAIGDADTLIEAVMGERGYPVGDFDTRLEDLSVQHADVIQHYRAAHEIAGAAEAGDADTEALRRAMVHYRALFAALLDDGIDQHRRNVAEDDADARTTVNGNGSRRRR